MVGLEANLAASTALVGNQRGIHLHFGDSCNNAAAGGAHYYSGGADPWVKVRYGATDAAGGGFSAFVVNGTSIGPIDGRRIIVHNDAAARKACGRLGVVTLPAGAGTANEAVGLSPGAVAGIVLHPSHWFGCMHGVSGGAGGVEWGVGRGGWGAPGSWLWGNYSNSMKWHFMISNTIRWHSKIFGFL